MGIISNKLHASVKLLQLCPNLYILMQKAVILDMYCIVGKFLVEEWIRNAWSLRPVLVQEPYKLLDDDDDK
jgi:hypothetical protein